MLPGMVRWVGSATAPWPVAMAKYRQAAMMGTMPCSTVCIPSDGVRRLPTARTSKPPASMMIAVIQSIVFESIGGDPFWV